MTLDQALILIVLFGTLGLFIWGRWRYDVVALLALLAVAILGLVPSNLVFSGFGHPAVITVAAVLVISQALTNSGAVDKIGKKLAMLSHRPISQVAALTGLVACCSAFMNNIGALALFMPLALQMCQQDNRPTSEVLMPLSFGSLLGGLMTLIGTPPNVIIATYRQELTGESFGMFAFAPVGMGVALVGVAFISLIGWRLLPNRMGAKPGTLFDITAYITETRLPEKSKLVGRELREIENIGKGDVSILALVRGNRRLLAPGQFELLRADDLLILEGHSNALKALVVEAGLEMGNGQTVTAEDLNSERVGIFEAVVRPGSRIEGRSAAQVQLHERFGVNLMALSRQGESMRQRISRIPFQVGDVLLLQGETKTMAANLNLLGCLPLAQRKITLGQPQQLMPAIYIFMAAILLTALGLLPAHVAFTAAAITLVLTNLMSLREAYASIDGPIIILLSAMIPVGQALENTGATALLATGLAVITGDLPNWAILTILMVTAMSLSDVINNAATAVIMAPIAAGVANALQLPVDPFLMTVAVGSSCTFMTPIGHQSNALVMGPGGYGFGDYWRMGLPLGILVVLTAVPLITLFWSL